MSLLLSYYGDDFTGSTDVLEALSLAGVETTLFLDPPDSDALARFPDARAVGIAGTGRAMSPSEMDAALPETFERMRDLKAAISLYKICSTFDSSPRVGSIGRALELGRRAFGGKVVPLLVAVPRLGRYCVFGHLFAESGAGNPVYRLDRHPTMRRHPVTPMTESDLLEHLALQTDLPSARIDIRALRMERGACKARFAQLSDEHAVVLFDALEDRDLAAIGDVVLDAGVPFAVASSGMAYALGAAWQAAGVAQPTQLSGLGPVEQLLVLSGSCSPVSAAQIRDAESRGFAVVPIDAAKWIGSSRGREMERAQEASLRLLREGHSVVLHTCLGPDDERIEGVRAALEATGSVTSSAKALGNPLGSLLRDLLEAHPVPRVIVAGGDTSGFVAGALGIEALTFAAPLVPGGPLCKVHSENALDGMEIAFKGGQTGTKDIYSRALKGDTKGS